MTTSDTPKRRWPVWPWLVLTVAGVVVTTVAAVVAATARSDAGPAPAAAKVTVTQYTTVTATATITLPPPPGPATLITNGLHAVGANVQPGRYETAGPNGTNPGGCYWSRADAGGTVIDNGRLTGPGTITVNPNELVDSNGCQVWHKVP